MSVFHRVKSLGRVLPVGVFLRLSLCAFAAPPEVLFVGYNVENYLTAQRDKTPPKPEKEIAALVQIVADLKPDILGLCEMGTREDFDDFRGRLAKAGVEFQDSEWIEAADTTRHLALLSRFPIKSRQSVSDASYELNGRPQRVLRGFLDVTVEIVSGYHLRLLGAHLKSHLAAPEGEAIVRRHEAHTLRQHIEKIIAANPNENLLCYGDFNDTKDQPVIHEIIGPRSAGNEMRDLWLRDSLGDRWTYYRKFTDSYDRIDYILVNRALSPEVERDRSGIYRSSFWNEASDHRPVFTRIIAKDR